MRNQLQRAVIALAQPAGIQLSLFPDFVCKADELALDFEDGLYEMVGHEAEFSDEQRKAINILNQLLSKMVGEQHASFWTEAALREHPVWEEIRDAAKAAAATFGWDLQAVPSSNAVYIPAGSNGG
ncbi:MULTISPECIES: hypothetical protein [Sphingomonas]|uniref:Uncharacterized protein n=1 Tax=Sphingomonas leidyi TaxID=68569 RepID=A0A7X5ZWR1_9SPHN|nr:MULTISPECIES: hypothetical protein [Sphingomonas]MBN8811192.1 hypothetical protein [Sphingomonas sp.]NIJ66495.1 hypothetical protein [Sphingomonas leidyi]OJY54660.1 MAG: hypothetical protein BGP17_06485 [Sphingomonas sp. 67-41]